MLHCTALDSPARNKDEVPRLVWTNVIETDFFLLQTRYQITVLQMPVCPTLRIASTLLLAYSVSRVWTWKA